MEPLTPDTSAFLSYLSSNFDPNTNSFSLPNENVKNNPTSLPPSAFFNLPLPGRDTPEDTPPSSTGAPSQSPEKNNVNTYRNLTPESADESSEKEVGKGRRKSDVTHKRKAGQGHKHNHEEEDDDESASDFTGGHEDKRQHNATKNQPTGGRRGGRKSTGTLAAADEAGLSSKEKSARRKEQNRAAQKAFRERRENKVKDLEDKVAELEAKSFGTNVENENLRGILKRLQEENMALKQSAFTFSMPANGGASAESTPARQTKPPTPSHSNSEDVLVSVHDAPPLPHRSSSSTSGMSGASPDSIVSNNTASTSDTNSSTVNWPKNLFDVNAFNAFALGGGVGVSRPSLAPPNATPQFSNTAIAPSTSKTDVDALFAHLYPEGIDSILAQNSGQLPADITQNTPFGNQAQSTPFAASPGKAFNTSAYRDTTAPALPQTDWADFSGSSVDDFLASLTGGNADLDSTTADDDFDASIRQILGTTSPSEQFALPNGNIPNPFSPTSYLNMPVSPPDSNSNSHSPGSAISFNNTASASGSNATSPESACDGPRSDGLAGLGSGFGTTGPPKAVGEHVYVVDADGKVIKPSQLWTMMGMQHESDVEHLLIDDLCDQMRSKATCKDGVAYLNAEDAKTMFQRRGVDKAHDTHMDNRWGAENWK